MQERLRQWWTVGKTILALAIVAGVGWQFARTLRSPELHDRSLQPDARGLTLAAGLYLGGLGLWALYWGLLLRRLGQAPAAAAVIRAYFVGHLGKYVPGKAWALLIRTTLIAQAGVRPGVGAMTATYETLTTMAAGALLAVGLFTWVVGETEGAIWKAAALLALAGIPILPGVFNRLVRRVSAPFVKAAAGPLPPVPPAMLLIGLLIAGCGWGLMGASLGSMIWALEPATDPWTWSAWGHCTAYAALAYVAGFLVLVSPGGLGVREVLLQQVLAPQLGAAAVLVALWLRLSWTVAEVAVAAVVYWLPASGRMSPRR